MAGDKLFMRFGTGRRFPEALEIGNDTSSSIKLIHDCEHIMLIY